MFTFCDVNYYVMKRRCVRRICGDPPTAMRLATTRTTRAKINMPFFSS